MKDYERLYKAQPPIRLPGRDVDLGAGNPTVRPQSVTLKQLAPDAIEPILGAGTYGISKYGGCTYQTLTTVVQYHYAVYA